MWAHNPSLVYIGPSGSLTLLSPLGPYWGSGAASRNCNGWITRQTAGRELPSEAPCDPQSQPLLSALRLSFISLLCAFALQRPGSLLSGRICCRRRHLSSALGGLLSATAGKLAAAASQPPVSSSKPRVVLIGWLGAQERHFNKYVQLWEGWGHKTLTIRPPTAAIALPLLGDLAAANFARRLHDANVAAAPDQQSVIHLFR